MLACQFAGLTAYVYARCSQHMALGVWTRSWRRYCKMCEQIPGARVFGMIALKPLMAHMEPNKGAKRIFYSLWKLRFFLGFMLKGSFFLQCNFCSTEACCFNFHNTCVYVKLLRVVHKYKLFTCEYACTFSFYTYKRCNVRCWSECPSSP